MTDGTRTIDHGPVSRCRICESGDLRELPFGYRFEGAWLEGTLCGECGMIFLNPQPAPEDLGRMYAKEYFLGDFRCGHEGSYFDDATLQKLVNVPLLEQIIEHSRGNRFLEIGCAGGALLDAARKAGLEVTGVEFSPDAAAFARQRFGLDVRTGDLSDVRFTPSSFDAVFMGDVLEHLPDPLRTLREIRRITAPGGVLLIHCPTQTNTLYSRLGFLVYGAVGKKATVHLPPYHLFEYRPGSMSKMIERAGFEVIRTVRTAIPPARVNLRGSGLQKLLKKAFQYPNWAITKLTGYFGDRIELIARVPGGKES